MTEADTPHPGLVQFVCNHCQASKWMQSKAIPDPPWRAFSMLGWVGDFHACSLDCEEAIRQRVRR